MPGVITLTGEPRSTQHIYHYTCKGRFPSMYMTAAGKDLKTAYKLEAKAQWKKRPTKRAIDLSVSLFFGTKRKADVDNFNKLSLDALTGVVYEDDSQISDLHIHRRYDPKHPRIEIEVRYG